MAPEFKWLKVLSNTFFSRKILCLLWLQANLNIHRSFSFCLPKMELFENNGNQIRPCDVIVFEKVHFQMSTRRHDNSVFKFFSLENVFQMLRFRWSFLPDTCGWKPTNPKRKSCVFKQTRIREDGTLDSVQRPTAPRIKTKNETFMILYITASLHTSVFACRVLLLLLVFIFLLMYRHNFICIAAKQESPIVANSLDQQLWQEHWLDG